MSTSGQLRTKRCLQTQEHLAWLPVLTEAWPWPHHAPGCYNAKFNTTALCVCLFTVAKVKPWRGWSLLIAWCSQLSYKLTTHICDGFSKCVVFVTCSQLFVVRKQHFYSVCNSETETVVNTRMLACCRFGPCWLNEQTGSGSSKQCDAVHNETRD